MIEESERELSKPRRRERLRGQIMLAAFLLDSAVTPERA